MKIRLTKSYLRYPAGMICDFGGANVTLVARGMAEWVDKDIDKDGRAEGGRDGEKKAFSRPPFHKGKRR